MWDRKYRGQSSIVDVVVLKLHQHILYAALRKVLARVAVRQEAAESQLYCAGVRELDQRVRVAEQSDQPAASLGLWERNSKGDQDPRFSGGA